MDKEYFKEYYLLERNHWWFKVREKIIKDKIRKYSAPRSPLKILNIGAATGRSSEMLEQFGHVTSIEFDKDCYEFTKNNVNITIHQGSILDLDFSKQSFDVVCAFDVIEHVEDDSKAVSEMKRVCKKGGVVCITVPALMQLWSHHDVINHHYRRYRMQEVIRLFNNSKGTTLYKSYFNSLLFLPIMIFRTISNHLPKRLIKVGSGSNFSVYTNGHIANIFSMIFSFERLLLKKITFPAGVSIIFLWRE